MSFFFVSGISVSQNTSFAQLASSHAPFDAQRLSRFDSRDMPIARHCLAEGGNWVFLLKRIGNVQNEKVVSFIRMYMLSEQKFIVPDTRDPSFGPLGLA